jgi:hypothetical protein
MPSRNVYRGKISKEICRAEGRSNIIKLLSARNADYPFEMKMIGE